MHLASLVYRDILMKKERCETMVTRINYEEAAQILKALSHPLRLEIVHGLLLDGCHNVRCIESNTGVSQSCISQHLQRLRAAGVVTAERSGNEVYYKASSKQVGELVAALAGEEAVNYVL